MKKGLILFFSMLFLCFSVRAESGYDLWLRYTKVNDHTVLTSYLKRAGSYYVAGSSPTLTIVDKELARGLSGLLGRTIRNSNEINSAQLIIAIHNDKILQPIAKQLETKTALVSPDGFIIFSTTLHGKKVTVITGQSEFGLLYGTFHFLKLMQCHRSLENLDLLSNPKIQLRMLNHWDNLDRTVERGYAGFSLWDWHKLPDYIDPRYHDYARANASIGINGTVLTNVNAKALVLTPMYLEKVKALADVFRPYGIRVFLTARFNAPMEIGGLNTADPLDEKVKQWWKDKANEIYTYVPDFGGFVVKANSEGQPGPQNYGRTHADGANMLALALKPHGGIVMWRAFVYSNEVPVDRTKQAYDEFAPLDGKFDDNVIIQVKNGPLDFQPREPFHPLFGGLKATQVMMEFQITQEYLGFATHLVFLSTLFEECLRSDTYQFGRGSTVARVVDGSLQKQRVSAIAGVSNIGTDRNWCGHQFAQANWYAFGRLAWDHTSTSTEIADEWIRMTFSNDSPIVSTITQMMLSSRENAVNYMTPLGLHHIMGWDHHYGPAPWIKDKSRIDWTSVYYHRADSLGVGFNRSSTGSDALIQYHPEVRKLYESVQQCPEEYLLWFHHVRWNYRMTSGRTLWEELCHRYDLGVAGAFKMQADWEKVKPAIDSERFTQVREFLAIQCKEAKWWRDACLSYFQAISNHDFPPGFIKPPQALSYYMQLSFPYAPGIRPQW